MESPTCNDCGIQFDKPYDLHRHRNNLGGAIGLVDVCVDERKKQSRKEKEKRMWCGVCKKLMKRPLIGWYKDRHQKVHVSTHNIDIFNFTFIGIIFQLNRVTPVYFNFSCYEGYGSSA